MTIKADVAEVGHEWANSAVFAALLQAVDRAEGDLVKAVACTVPSVTTRDEALRITARSAAHAMVDYIVADPARKRAFVDFWAARWAPRGAGNDPQGLNAHWPGNVHQLWTV